MNVLMVSIRSTPAARNQVGGVLRISAADRPPNRLKKKYRVVDAHKPESLYSAVSQSEHNGVFPGDSAGSSACAPQGYRPGLLEYARAESQQQHA